MMQQLNMSFTIQTVAPVDDQKAMCLKLNGHLAGDGVFMLKRAVEPLFVSPLPPKLKLLMDGVTYMDSGGVGIIISIIQRMQEHGGKLEIHGLSDVGRELFQILKLASLNEIVSIHSRD